MILIDYNAISIAAAIAARKFTDESEEALKHCILNSIRMHNVNFRKKYGQVVICCDSRSWRKDVYPEYKASRKQSRDDDAEFWDRLFKVIDDLRQDLENFFPYKVIKVDDAEADDIIGALAYQTEEFGHFEDVMIVSGDKDFVQLQVLPNVSQYSPIQKKYLKEDNPRLYLLEHILKGDGGDGVPNVLSPDNTFVDGLRQTPVRKKFIDEVVSYSKPEEAQVFTEETRRNFHRNKKMVDLRETPVNIRERVLNKYHEQQDKNDNSKVLPYLINKRHKMLIDSVEDFFYYG